MRFSLRVRLGLLTALTAGGLYLSAAAARSDDKSKPSAEAIERARELVQIVDNMHKAYVIHVTATYVRAQESVPAASVARKVYTHMTEKKFFTGRLIDASGKPINVEN